MSRRPAPGKRRAPLPPRDSFDPSVHRALLIALAALIALRIGAAAFTGPDLRLWGVDFARWLPGRWDVLLALLLPLAALLPPVRDLLARIIGSRREHRSVMYWIGALVALGLSAAVARWLTVAFAFLRQ